jgi:hypothetical protein
MWGSSIWSGVGWLVGRLGAASSECVCHCSFAADPNEGVIALLGKQLERCGPERLSCPVCVPTACPAVEECEASGLGFSGCVVLLLVGVVIGAVLGKSLGSSKPAAHPSQPALEQAAPVVTASLDDGEAAVVAPRGGNFGAKSRGKGIIFTA